MKLNRERGAHVAVVDGDDDMRRGSSSIPFFRTTPSNFKNDSFGLPSSISKCVLRREDGKPSRASYLPFLMTQLLRYEAERRGGRRFALIDHGQPRVEIHFDDAGE